MRNWTTLLGGCTALLAAGLLAPPQVSAAEEEGEPGLWERQTLTGNWGGLRSRLADSGLTLSLTEISELLGNVSGGQRRGLDYMGRTDFTAEADLDKLAGWQGGLVHVTGYQIHGRGLSSHNLGGSILPPSNIEASRTTRLFTAWFQQSLMNDDLSVRVGQIAADDEFLTSQYSGNFINGTFGWAAIMAANLASGGPAYPLATPGIRLKYSLAPGLTWQTAVTNGDPAGSPTGAADPQIRNRAGVTFSTNRDAFLISEIGWSEPTAGMTPTTVKLGGWYHSGRFDDRRIDAAGGSLAATGGTPRRHDGNFGIYGVIDRVLLPKAGTDDQGLSGFLRIGAAPGDRNLVSAYADTGLVYKGPIEGRDEDVAGLAFSIARIGSAARGFDRDYNLANPAALRPVRDYEAVIELTYQFVAAPWWTLQPDLQYVIHPGGRLADPTADPTLPASAMGNALILGARTQIRF